jgi:hypothetical protein
MTEPMRARIAGRTLGVGASTAIFSVTNAGKPGAQRRGHAKENRPREAGEMDFRDLAVAARVIDHDQPAIGGVIGVREGASGNQRRAHCLEILAQLYRSCTEGRRCSVC